MKRFIPILMLFSLLLVGCTPAVNEPLQTEPPTPVTTVPVQTQTEGQEAAEATTQSEDVLEYVQRPMIAVSVPAVREYQIAEDGTALFRHTSQTMRLVMQDPEVADRIILDFLNRVDKSSANSEEIRKQAQTAYDNGNLATTYVCETLYSPTRLDESVLSLFGTTVSYSGGIHPERNCIAANYDLVSGDVLTLGSILTHADGVSSLSSLVVKQLDAIAEAYYLYDDYQQIAQQRFAGEESYDEDWYFTDTGLCFYFSPYEIAPYASGVITVEIPYESLTGIIEDAFFPPERDMAIGTIQAARGADIDLSQFTQIAEVTVDQGGEQVFLYTGDAVQNLRIQAGNWDDSGTVFTPEYTVFATYSLTPGDAVMVETYIPDVMPTLQLTYQSAGETITVYISQSGEDGSIILISE